MSDAEVVRFPVERCHPKLPAGVKHFSCAHCGKAGFLAREKPSPGRIRCGDCGCEEWAQTPDVGKP